MREQIIKENKGITDLDPDDPTRSLTQRGYAHWSGREFTNDLIGNFGEWIRAFVQDGFVVELGCGSGVLSRYCKSYVGLDGNLTAGNECIGEFFSVDLTAPYAFDPPIEADILLSFDFFEHIEEESITILIEQADRLLRRGAKIFLVIDNRTIEEHVSVHDSNWWKNKIQQANVNWVYEELTNEFKEDYYNNLPVHWNSAEPPRSFQMLFLFSKK